MKYLLLSTLNLAGVLTVAVLAPNALKTFVRMGILKTSYNRGRYMRNAVTRLREQGYITFEKREGIIYARITPKGEQELRRYRLGEYREHYEKPKRWDKKWRVVIFDIKEQNKTARHLLREELTRWGFLRLQNSVWVYPYPCEEYIALLKTNFELGKSVLYMIVEEIENDQWLREAFDLPRL